MDALFIVALIIYTIIGVTAKKKKTEQKAAAQELRRRAARAAEETPPVESEPSSPAASFDKYPPLVINRPASEEKRVPQERNAPQLKKAPSSRMQAAPVSRSTTTPETRMHTSINTQLTEISATSRHSLEASSITGHAHEETSMSGLEEDCASTTDRKRVLSSAPAIVSLGGGGMRLSMDVNAVRSAIIYSEILGKPKALRR